MSTSNNPNKHHKIHFIIIIFLNRTLTLKLFTELSFNNHVFYIMFLILLSTPTLLMADFEAGIKANQAGDRHTAFIEFKAAAEDKNNQAYGKLGSMYLYGLGTEKNYQQAYIWFHMAYLSGEREGERYRDAASSMMTREQYLLAVDVAESQRIKQGLGKAPPQTKPPVH